MHHESQQCHSLNLVPLQAYEESAGDSAEQSKEAFRAQVVGTVTFWSCTPYMPYCNVGFFTFY